MFDPHPNLADEVNRGIIQSEIEGGVFLNDLPPSTVLEIQTMHHRYTAVLLGGSEALLSGHPEFYISKRPTSSGSFSLFVCEVDCHCAPVTGDVIQEKPGYFMRGTAVP